MKTWYILALAFFFSGCDFDINWDENIATNTTTGKVTFDIDGKHVHLSDVTLDLPSDPANFFSFSVGSYTPVHVTLQFYSYNQKTEGQNIEVNFEDYTNGYFQVVYQDSLYQTNNIEGSYGRAYMLIESLTENSAKGTFHFTIARNPGDSLRVTNGVFDLKK